MIRIHMHHFSNGVRKGTRCYVLFSKKFNRPISERVVHHSVKLIALEPRHRVMPNFYKNIAILLNIIDYLYELLQKCMLNLIGYIKSSTINIKFADLVLGDI